MSSSGNITVDSRTIAAWAHEIDVPESVATALCRAYLPLARWLGERHTALGGPLIVGVNGAQGTGKSTLLALLVRMMRELHELRAAGLSLDDIYLTIAEREELARSVHPLLRTRGVPGTHDVELGHRVLDALTGAPGTAALPSFDKALDDRMPRQRWHVVETPADVVIFEGWCMGALPEEAAILDSPVNDLEREQDPDGRWRRYVNEQLAGPYAALFRRLDVLVMLKAPDMDAVVRWRTEQEAALSRRLVRAGRTDTAMDPERVARFVQYFERLTRSMFEEMPSRADVVVDIDEDHRIAAVRFRDGGPT